MLYYVPVSQYHRYYETPILYKVHANSIKAALLKVINSDLFYVKGDTNKETIEIIENSTKKSFDEMTDTDMLKFVDDEILGDGESFIYAIYDNNRELIYYFGDGEVDLDDFSQQKTLL